MKELAVRREQTSWRPPQIQCQREREVGLSGWDGHDSRCMPNMAEAGETPALSLQRVNRRLGVSEPARIDNVVRATPDRTSRPPVHDIKHERRVHRDGRMQARCRLPCAVSHASNEFALFTRG